jgi:hypothetical protein
MKYLKLYENIDWDDWDEEEYDEYINIFKGSEDFYYFLKEEGVLEKYINNANSFSIKISTENLTIKKLLDIYNHSPNGWRMFVVLFDWKHSPEGYDFWFNIHNKWLKLKLKKLNESIDFDDIDEEEDFIHPEFFGFEKFYNFLNERELLDKFVYYYDSNFADQNPQKINDYLKTTNVKSYIDYAFSWTNTDDGHDFWENIQYEWRDSIKLNESINFDDIDDEEYDDFEKKRININNIKVGDIIYAKDTFYMRVDVYKRNPFIIKDEGYKISGIDINIDQIIVITHQSDNHYFNDGSYNYYFYKK